MEKHPTETIPAYALKCLDLEEYEQVRKHISKCAVCLAEVKQIEQTLANMSHAAPVTEPPASLKSRLMSSLRTGRSFAWFEQLVIRWPRLVPSAGLAAMMLAIVFGIMSFALLHQKGQFSEQDLSRIQFARFQGTAVMPEASGVLLVTADKQQGILVVSALQPLDQTKQYQLWLIKDGRRTNGGVFSVSSAGDAHLIVSTDIPLGTYDAFGVTIEPFGGSQGPTGPKVLGGSMVL